MTLSGRVSFSSSCCEFLSLSLLLMALTALDGQEYCRMPFYWHLSNVFLIRHVMDFGQEDHKGKMSFYHIIPSTWFITVNADCDHLAYFVFVRFLHCNVTLFYSPICTLLFGRESVCASHTTGVGGRAAPLFGGVSTITIWNSSAPICLFSPLLIYSVIFLSSWTHGY